LVAVRLSRYWRATGTPATFSALVIRSRLGLILSLANSTRNCRSGSNVLGTAIAINRSLVKQTRIGLKI
jgi:hypothetical protein